jgi:taurine dioxygenase
MTRTTSDVAALDLDIRRLGGAMGAEVLGIDLAEPLVDDVADALRAALLEHLVLCIRDQAIEPEQFVAACRLFGETQEQLLAQWRHESVPEIQLIANQFGDRLDGGKPIVQGAHWHTDDSYFASPAKMTALHAVQLPEHGGDTGFANMYAAYDELPAELKSRIEHLRARHVYRSSRGPNPVARRTEEERARTPDVVHPLVRTHPETGRRALYVNPNRIECIEGLERGESDALLDTLYEHAFQSRFQYRHIWRLGDIVIWDNRCTTHHANADFPPDQPRVLHRVMLKGTVPA